MKAFLDRECRMKRAALRNGAMLVIFKFFLLVFPQSAASLAKCSVPIVVHFLEPAETSLLGN
jgi:hypothetical protein